MWAHLLDLTEIFVRTSTGMPYLDVIRRLREASTLPIAAYQVSGEYAMLKAAALNVSTPPVLLFFIMVIMLLLLSLDLCRAGWTRKRRCWRP